MKGLHSTVNSFKAVSQVAFITSESIDRDKSSSEVDKIQVRQAVTSAAKLEIFNDQDFCI